MYVEGLMFSLIGWQMCGVMDVKMWSKRELASHLVKRKKVVYGLHRMKCGKAAGVDGLQLNS